MPEPHTNVYRSRPQLVFDNFLGGVAWGVGSVIGATLVVSLVAFILTQTRELPLIGKIVESVMIEVEKQQTQ